MRNILYRTDLKGWCKGTSKQTRIMAKGVVLTILRHLLLPFAKISKHVVGSVIFTNQTGNHAVCRKDAVVNLVPVESVSGEEVHHRHLSCNKQLH
jgi:hypothetical protein